MSEAVARVSPAVPPARSVHITPRPSPPADEEEGPGAPARSPARPRHTKPARQGLQPPRRSPGSCGFSPRIRLPLKQIAWYRRGRGAAELAGGDMESPRPSGRWRGGPRTPPRAAHTHNGPPVQTSLHAHGWLPCTPTVVPVHTLAPLHNSTAPCTPIHTPTHTPAPLHTHAHPHQPPCTPVHTLAPSHTPIPLHTHILPAPCTLTHTCAHSGFLTRLPSPFAYTHTHSGPLPHSHSVTLVDAPPPHACGDDGTLHTVTPWTR